MYLEGSFQNRLDWACASIDLSSIARGYATLDAMVKRATVKIDFAKAVSTGRFVIILSGEIAELDESYLMALEVGSSCVLDHVSLSRPHWQLTRAMRSAGNYPLGQSAFIAEFNTVSSTLLAADIALKACDLHLGSLTLAKGIGAKGFFVAHGELCDIEAARVIVENNISQERIVALEIIANPHPEIAGLF